MKVVLPNEKLMLSFLQAIPMFLCQGKNLYISLRTLLFSANVTDETLFDIYNNLPNY